MILRYIVIFLFAHLFLCSCNNIKNEYLSINKLEKIDSFNIGSNLRPSFYNTYTNINYPYLTTISEEGNEILILHLETFDVNRININSFLKKYSIDQLNNYCFVRYDSIFINGFNSNVIYRIDSSLNLLSKYIIKPTSKNRTLINSYSNPIHSVNNHLILAYQNTAHNNYFVDSSHRDKFFSESIAYNIDLNKLETISNIGNYPSYFRLKNDYYDWYINSCKNHKSITYLFSNIDTLYTYELNSNKVKKISINNKFHSENNFFNHKKAYDYNDIRKYYVENSFYNRIYYNHLNNKYYILYSKGVEFEKDEYENNLYKDKSNILIIHDLHSKENIYIIIDDDYIPESISFNSNGLLIAKKIYKNLKYYVFKI